MNNINEIRNKLRQFVTSEEGKALRHKLFINATNNYKQKYSSDEYVAFLERNMISTKEVDSQEVNFPYVYELFSVVTQHIYGDCIVELFDKAIDIEKQKGVIL